MILHLYLTEITHTLELLNLSSVIEEGTLEKYRTIKTFAKINYRFCHLVVSIYVCSWHQPALLPSD